jgi:hypothetical protein
MWWLGEGFRHHLRWKLCETDCSMCDVVFDEVVLETYVFGFVAHQCVLRVCDGALVVFRDGGGLVIGTRWCRDA